MRDFQLLWSYDEVGAAGYMGGYGIEAPNNAEVEIRIGKKKQKFNTAGEGVVWIRVKFEKPKVKGRRKK